MGLTIEEAPALTDRERLLELLKSFGIPMLADTQGYQVSGMGVTENIITLMMGEGYAGFYCDFIFDNDGKFESFGVWE